MTKRPDLQELSVVLGVSFEGEQSNRCNAPETETR